MADSGGSPEIQLQRKKMTEDDARREAAMAASACLQPDFVPKSAKITSAHLSKLQELHKRRLQIKSKPKIEKEIKGKGKSQKKEIGVDVAESIPDEQNSSFESSPATQKKRKKLHWGLDTKERWEMKANM